MVLASFAYANRNRIVKSNPHVYICLQTTDIGLSMVITCLSTKNICFLFGRVIQSCSKLFCCWWWCCFHFFICEKERGYLRQDTREHPEEKNIFLTCYSLYFFSPADVRERKGLEEKGLGPTTRHAHILWCDSFSDSCGSRCWPSDVLRWSDSLSLCFRMKTGKGGGGRWAHFKLFLSNLIDASSCFPK